MADTTKKDEYIESDAVKAAKAALEQQAAQKPGAYQSQWQDSLNKAMDKILNREKFSYDLNGDALYQQYKNQYMNQGKQAMMDTMGQASALTGGYGNSYAQTAGQQTYQGYLQGLNDKVPELYQLARNAYDSDTAELYNQYGLFADREDQDYGRYRDQVGDFESERDYLSGQYDNERNYDYGKYADSRDFSYQQDRDAAADAQWQKEFDEAVKRFLATADSSTRAYYENYGKTPEEGTTSTGNKILDFINGITGGSLKVYNGSSSSSSSSSLDDVVNQVIRGDWGNGTDRKKALEAAGYDYATVQAAVNKAMAGMPVDTTPTAPVTTPVTNTGSGPDMDDVKTVKASMMTRTEFARHNGGASTDGVKYANYNDYVKACLDQYSMAGLDDETYAYLAAYYGLK